MHEMWRDLRYGVRSLARMPGFAAVTVLALGLGIGANTAIFSLVNAILLRPLPYPESERVVILYERTATGGEAPVSGANFLDWQARATSFSAMTATAGGAMILTGADPVERISVLRASAGFFDVLGVRPALGRVFRPEEDRAGAAPVVLLSYGAWERRYGRDPGILGQNIALDGRPFTVIGVLPTDFRFFRPMEALIPLAPQRGAPRDDGSLIVLARLKPGIAPERARAEMAAAAGEVASATVEVLHHRLVRGPRADLPILIGAAAFVLLIACANVASLLLAKAAARRQEIAVRAALGAGRPRLLRQLLTESALLSLSGGGLGLLLAAWLLRLLARAVPAQALPPGAALSVDARVLLFTLALSLATAVLFGLAPAWRASRVDLQEELKQASRGSTRSGARLRAALVASELALSLVLIAAAGLLVRSLLLAQNLRAGFDSDNLLTLRVELPGARYDTPEKLRLFFGRSLERLSALPGARLAAFSTQLPLRGWAFGTTFDIAERPSGAAAKRPMAHLQITSPDYFRTLGIALRKGRHLSPTDTAGAGRVAVVNDAFARRFFGEEDPLGKRLRIPPVAPDGSRRGAPIEWQIVGVVGSVGLGDLNSRSPDIYVPYAQSPYRDGYLSVRTAADPLRLAQAAQAAVESLDKSVLVSDVRSMEQLRQGSFRIPRIMTSLIGGFGALALLLSVMGIYGLMSWLVSQRAREMGIRMALGAEPRAVLRLFLRQGLGLAAIGLAVGLAGAIALTRLLRHWLFGVVPQDPLTLLAASAILLLAAAAACYFPGRRASRIDPVVSLRQD